MSSRPGQHEQPSAAKPRDLRQDLAIAGHTTKKRKADGSGETEAQVRTVSTLCTRLLTED